MFKPGDYIIKMIDPETRYVRRIVAIEGDKYVVEDPSRVPDDHVIVVITSFTDLSPI